MTTPTTTQSQTATRIHWTPSAQDRAIKMPDLYADAADKWDAAWAARADDTITMRAAREILRDSHRWLDGMRLFDPVFLDRRGLKRYPANVATLGKLAVFVMCDSEIASRDHDRYVNSALVAYVAARIPYTADELRKNPHVRWATVWSALNDADDVGFEMVRTRTSAPSSRLKPGRHRTYWELLEDD